MKKFLATILSVILLLSIIPMAYAESAEYKVGDIIQFGSYPQSEVKDENLIAELNAIAPEWDEWTSYGYYSGDGNYGSMVQGDWMRYTDVIYNNLSYRGVKYTKYRSNYTYTNWGDYSYRDIYHTNTIYWFKFEPIDWRILDPTTGVVVSEMILDSQAYSNTIYYHGEYYNYYDKYNYSLKNYASDYKTSSIRKWLNDNFYNLAFTNDEKREIVVTDLINTGYYTSRGITSYRFLDSENTNDNIFLLSLDDAKNSNYGFSSTEIEDDVRKAEGSDYAKCQGLYKNASWLLRTSGSATDRCVSVEHNGNINENYFVYFSANGVRPAFKFKDLTNIHQHKYMSVINKPTCTEKGYTTYTCECGDTYIDNYTDENGHSFTNYISDGKATCSTNGLKIAKCDNCDATDSIVISGDHSFSDEWTIDEDPTCKEEGMKSHHCKYCPARKDFTPIGKLAHDFVTVRVEPTCLDEGYTITACKCGEEIIEPIAPTGHDYDGSKCKICDYDRADDCSCNCHKGGIAGLFWKIINLFNKLFKSKQFCACGAKHW